MTANTTAAVDAHRGYSLADVMIRHYRTGARPSAEFLSEEQLRRIEPIRRRRRIQL